MLGSNDFEWDKKMNFQPQKAHHPTREFVNDTINTLIGSFESVECGKIRKNNNFHKNIFLRKFRVQEKTY